jgi:hypothetical protein
MKLYCTARKPPTYSAAQKRRWHSGGRRVVALPTFVSGEGSYDIGKSILGIGLRRHEWTLEGQAPNKPEPAGNKKKGPASPWEKAVADPKVNEISYDHNIIYSLL